MLNSGLMMAHKGRNGVLPMIIKFPTAAESEAADRRHTRALTHALRAEMAAIQRAQAIVASRAFYGGDHLCSQCEQPITECVCYNVIVRDNDEPDGWGPFCIGLLAMAAAAAIIMAFF